MTDKYFKLKVSTDKPVNDLIVGLLSDVGAEGFVEEENELICYFSEGNWNSSFESEVSKFLSNLKIEGKISRFTIDISEIQNQDWNREWEESIIPIEVTKDIVIKPSWKEYKGEAKIIIEIDPKMSFGTGHHETTRMMVQLLDRLLKTGASVLDVGTGTGVLAIAAVKLGASSCIAIDTDDWSIENARENIERNGAAGKIELIGGEIGSVRETEFDIITANLNRNTLLYIKSELYVRCAADGILMLAGILTLDEKDVVAAYEQAGFKKVDAIRESEWSAVVLRK